MVRTIFESGCRHLDAGEFPQAALRFRESLALEPRVPELWNNLGIALFQAGERGEALHSFRQAIEINPLFAEALSNLGRALARCGEPAEGLDACRRALEIDPDFAGALENAGVILMECGRPGEALPFFDRLCAVRPASAPAWCNRGDALKVLGRLGVARASYRRALALSPESREGLRGLTSLLLLAGQAETAIDLLRAAVRRDPENAPLHSELLVTLSYASGTLPELAGESRLWGAIHGESSFSRVPAFSPSPERRVRIGYLSADLHRHPVGIFLAEVLKNHDRSAFEITCYQNGIRCDEVTERLKGEADRWCVIAGMSDAQAHELVKSHGIDVLVDLSGHTAGSRLPLFAGRPAPLQATWIGYSSSTGLPAMDYFITDAVSTPAGEEGAYTERLIRLPHCRFCYTPPLPSPFVDQLPAATNGWVTFGSFNNLAKLSAPVVELWARVLLAVPGSRLVLKWRSLATASVRRRIRRLFARLGVSPERIECRPASSHYLALAEYNDVDIALDTFPFNGGLTSCEALWMGVPVVTLVGEAPIGRQSAAFLETIGLPELIARDQEEYLALACSLAADLGRLARLREGLRERLASSPLCDGAGFTRNLERAYRTMIEERTLAGDRSATVPLLADCVPAAAPSRGAPLAPVLLPRQRLRIGYLLLDAGSPGRADLLEALTAHNPRRVSPYLYFAGALPEGLRSAACANGVRLRPVDALDGRLFVRLLQREGIDLLVELSAEGASRRADLGATVAVTLSPLDLPPAGDEAEPSLRRGAHAARLESFYLERWLSWFLAQPKPRASRRKGDAEASREMVVQGRELRLAGRLEEAELRLVEAVRKNPGNADALRNLGEVYVYQRRVAEALALFRRALLVDPRDLKARSNLLFTLNYADHGRELARAESRAWGRVYGRSPRKAPPCADAGQERPLRVGYLSADLCRHAVSYFLEPLLANHDRTSFESFCYSFVARPDRTTERLKGLATAWRDCAQLGDDEVARLMAKDGIDILVDLAGHTGARILLPIAARRPAPVQVSWLGYPNTTGLAAMDYRLTDAEVDPAGEERWYTERLVRLAGGFLCYLPPEDAPAPAPAPVERNGFVTFGSCNILPKLSDATLAAWAGILHRVLDARLVLKSPPLADPHNRERLFGLLEQLGVNRERVTLCGYLPSTADHLDFYRAIDLALDTFPYNGTTTTCEALWMGVPVLGLEGDRHAGRVTAGILRRVGLGELVAVDVVGYLERAVELARNPARLSDYRSRLRPLLAGSPLCDGGRFAAEVEGALRAMWRSRFAGRRGDNVKEIV